LGLRNSRLLEFHRDEFNMSLLVLRDSINEMKKYRCYSTVKHFFEDNIATIWDHFDELLALLEAVRENLDSRKTKKAGRSIRAAASWSPWI
jgi:hypothetical protein